MTKNPQLVKVLFIVLALFIVGGFTAAAERKPADVVDLNHWKLQFRGPTDVAARLLVNGFTNQYFYFEPVSGNMKFRVDASEGGSTAHSIFVRSELREQMKAGSDAENWSVQTGTHILKSRLKLMSSTLNPNKVTVLQIHGYPSEAPPLMRIAFEEGSLYVHCKGDNMGQKESKVNLGNYTDYLDCEVRVENQHLIIAINDQEKFNKNIDYWTWTNYFKAGAYPQSHAGIVNVEFQKLATQHY